MNTSGRVEGDNAMPFEKHSFDQFASEVRMAGGRNRTLPASSACGGFSPLPCIVEPGDG
jgi:hypothetical protein